MRIKDLQIDDSWKALQEGETIYEGYNMVNVPENILALEIVKVFAFNDTIYIETKNPPKKSGLEDKQKNEHEKTSALLEEEHRNFLNGLKEGKRRLFYDKECEWFYTENYFLEMYNEYKEEEKKTYTFEQFVTDTIKFNGGIIELKITEL